MERDWSCTLDVGFALKAHNDEKIDLTKICKAVRKIVENFPDIALVEINANADCSDTDLNI